MFVAVVGRYGLGSPYQIYLFGTICHAPVPKLVPIDQVRIEEGTIHTGELGFFTHG